MARDLLMLSLRLMLHISMVVIDVDMPVLDIPILAMLVSPLMGILVLATMARGLLMLSLKPRLMLLFFMEDMDMVVMDLDIPVLDIPVLDILDLVMLVSLLILVLATMARGLLMLSLKPMLHISMVDTDVDMLVLDMP